MINYFLIDGYKLRAHFRMEDNDGSFGKKYTYLFSNSGFDGKIEKRAG